jgi:transposase
MPPRRSWGGSEASPPTRSGLLLAVTVVAASMSENQAGIRVLDQAKASHPSIVKTWVDAGFKNQFVEHAATLGVDAEVVPRNVETKGFHVVKRRWVVERTLGWLMLHRRLARDYETLPASSEAMIHVAMIDNVSKRVTVNRHPPGEAPISTKGVNRTPSDEIPDRLASYLQRRRPGGSGQRASVCRLR